jgi:hypothetical protein
MVLEVWNYLEDHGCMTNEAGDMLECVTGRIMHMRDFTGWGGVPGKYLR